MLALEPVATSSAEHAHRTCNFPNVFACRRGNVFATGAAIRHQEGRVSIGETVTSQQDSRLWTFEEIGRLISESGNPTETLTNIVNLIQERFATDVCSVYLLEPDRANLVLAATIGLRPESIGRV